MNARRRLEWPTLVLAAAIYGGWIALTLAFRHLPLALAAPLGGLLLAWHGSLQHEAIHGHPTASRRANTFLAGIPLSIWLPYAVYRESHIAHHRTPELTHPGSDPESFYVDAERWARLGPLRRGLHWALNTLAGRLVLGPPVLVARTLTAEARRVAGGEVRHLGTWAVHGLGACAVLAWVAGVCGIHPLFYLGCFVYPGLSLTLLRSFVEHRPAAALEHRSAIVEANPILGALFLHNNLHILHHDEPHLPWYRLPARYRQRRSELIARNGGYRFSGYLEVARAYALRPKDAPLHPLAGEREC